MALRGLVILLAPLLFLGTGCFKKIPAVRVYSEGLVVEAEDGSFRLEGKEPVSTPFTSNCWGGVHDTLVIAGPENLAGRVEAGLRKGARRVKVHVPNEAAPLHGLLALCDADGTLGGPGAKVYSLAVTPQSVRDAKEGKIAVMTETYRNFGNHQNTWVLWLSSEPFAEAEAP